MASNLTLPMSTGTIADIPADRFERLERAILGDPDVGHLGAIQRLDIVDGDHRKVPELHAGMAKERIEGDRRLHERLDAHRDEEHKEQEDRMDRIERKIDRLLWMLLGSTAAGIAIGWGLGTNIPLGPVP